MEPFHRREALSFTLASIGFALLVLVTSGKVEAVGLLIVAIALCMTPVFVFTLFPEDRGVDLGILISVFVPLVYINYIYALRTGYPVGFQDVHSHLVETQVLFNSNGFIDFSAAGRISFEFVGLYVLERFVNLGTGLPPTTVAVILPPLLNVAILVALYSIVKRLQGPRVAVLATVLIGWDNVFLLYGHEYRPQTPAMLLLFVLVLLYSYLNTKGSTLGQTATRLIVIAGLVTFSFSFTVVSLTLVTAMWFTSGIRRGRELPSVWRPFLSEIIFLVVLLLAYVLYISQSSTPFFQALRVLVEDALASQLVQAPSVGQEVYGQFIQYFAYGYWALFGVIFLRLIWGRELALRKPLAVLIWPLLAVLALGVGLQNAADFSIGRTYSVGLVAVSVVVAVGAVRAVRHAGPRSRPWLKLAVVVVVVLSVSTSVAKLPMYIGGDPSPLRTTSAIDKVPYWELGGTDFQAAGFANRVLPREPTHLEMLIVPYPFLNLCQSKLKCLYPAPSASGIFTSGPLGQGDLVVARTGFNGANYTYESLLPSSSSYESFDCVYANGDYTAFWVP